MVSVKRKTWFDENSHISSAKVKPSVKLRLQSLEEARYMHKISKAGKVKCQLPS